jgi:hypothetical protein
LTGRFNTVIASQRVAREYAISQCRPCESRDPYAVSLVLRDAVRRLCAATNACGYGSLLSQGRRLQFSNSQNNFRYAPEFSRREAPELCTNHAPRKNQRAQGMPGARCARSLACKNKKAYEHSHHGHTGITRHSLRNGFNSFLRALPGDRAFLPPSSADIGWSAPGRADFASARLDASVGASGPHDFAVRFSAVRQRAVDNSQASLDPPCHHVSRLTLPRPSHPAPRP